MSSFARSQAAQRPRLLQAAIDAFGQPDIRQKLMFTIALLVVFRFVAHVPIPGVNPAVLEQVFEGNDILNFFNLFSGGALRNLSVASLGVYPYISATIVMQLLQPIVPSLQALQREGEQGRRRIQMYTHWLAVPLAFVQGYTQLIILDRSSSPSVFEASGFSPGFTGPDALPTMAALMSMAAGTMFLVWLGELITENGIGNGVSLIIFGGIVAGMPALLPQITGSSIGFSGLLLLAAVAVLVLALIVFFQEAQRRIPVQYARSVFRSGRMYRQSGATHIPLRVNSAGMIPLIFALSIVIFPASAADYVRNQWPGGAMETMADWVVSIMRPQSPGFMAAVFLLVVMFTFFYTLVVFQQQNLAENLQKQGGFIPGIRPGRPTAEYLMRVLVRITWAGAFFLGGVAILPYVLTRFTDVQQLTISSTGLLIVVGVVLDTMRQLEAQLMMRNYEGFIR